MVHLTILPNSSSSALPYANEAKSHHNSWYRASFQIILCSPFPLLQSWTKYPLSCDRSRRLNCHFSLLCSVCTIPHYPVRMIFWPVYIYPIHPCSRTHNGWLRVHVSHRNPSSWQGLPYTTSWVWEWGLLSTSFHFFTDPGSLTPLTILIFCRPTQAHDIFIEQWI